MSDDDERDWRRRFMVECIERLPQPERLFIETYLHPDQGRGMKTRTCRLLELEENVGKRRWHIAVALLRDCINRRREEM